MDAESLIDFYNAPAVNRIAEFAGVAHDLDVGQLARWYDDLVRAAPKRHDRDKLYLAGRTGTTSSGASSHRREEHLAVALYNASRDGAAFALPDGRPLAIINYQTPLKARQGDRGVGKVDLFGVADGWLPCIVELKVAGGDTPLRAILECLAYCAMVEANASEIASEAAEQHGLALSSPRPVLVVMAPDDYWTAFLGHPRAGRWLSGVRGLVAGLRDALGLEVHLLALLDAAFEMGLEGQPARLVGDCRLVSVDELLAGGERA